MAILLGMSSSFKGRKFDVDQDEVTIGRSTSNLIILDDPSISSQHCVILKQGNRYTLRDLDSTNGSRVNGDAIQECGLRPKDILQFGGMEFMFDGADIEADAETEAPPPDEPPVENQPADSPAESAAEQPVRPAGATNRVPASFKTASPYGSRSKHHHRTWFFVISGISLLVLGVLIHFIFTAL